MECTNWNQQKYLDMFYYCNLYLKRRFCCSLSSITPSSVVLLESVLTTNEKDQIKKVGENIRVLTQAEEKILFKEDNSRWEYLYEQFTLKYARSEQFYEDIVNLEHQIDTLNSKRSLYHKAYRFVADKDRLVSLKIYLRYLNVKSESETFKHWNISKANQKILFTGEEQKKRFFHIVEVFKKDGDLEKALAETDGLLVKKKKEIFLDKSAIQTAREDLKEVVDLLGLYLEEEETVETKEDSPQQSRISGLGLPQSELIHLFTNNSYELNISDIDTFAEKNGKFAGQLINDINEFFYEILDDFLIEENNNKYILNQCYYQKIQEHETEC